MIEYSLILLTKKEDYLKRNKEGESSVGCYDMSTQEIIINLPACHYDTKNKTEDEAIEHFCNSIQHEVLHACMWQILGTQESQKMLLPHTYHELVVRRMMGEYNEMRLVNYIAKDLTVKIGFPAVEHSFRQSIKIMQLRLALLIYFMFATLSWIGFVASPITRLVWGILWTVYFVWIWIKTKEGKFI